MRVCLLSLITVSVCFGAGCRSSSTPANQPPVQNNTIITSPATDTAPAPPAVGPAETLRALNAASKAGDVAGIKRYLSEGSLALLEEGAKEQNRPVEELLKEKDQAPFLELPELGKETINGETAIIEIKNPVTGAFEPFPLVKENGEWKVAIDLYLERFEVELEGDEQQP
ncbi:MAG: hypothetical protein WKF92_08385 [Pyrinomonadaceae bacterium]